jgi:hypothetical protein
MGRYPPVQRDPPRLVRFFGFGLPSAKIPPLLPRAADLFREQITFGLDGDPKAALGARTFLRELLSGEIRLVPDPDGVGLVAHWKLDTGALMRCAVSDGSGGRIPSLLACIRRKTTA